MPKAVPCPNCSKRVPWTPESHWRPFCSERCQLIDLGEWFDEGHRITEPADEGYASPQRDEEPERH